MNSSTCAVSVIIPAYNQAAYVLQAVQSVLDQTSADFELVVVDDGSTDQTPEILGGIHDARLRVIRQPNGGLSAARNTGLRESSAPWVTFLDADDFFLPDKLEVLGRRLAGNPDTGLVVGRARYVDQDGRVIGEQPVSQVKLALPDLLKENPVCVSAVLLRRAWLDRVGDFDVAFRACEDWDLWLRLLAAGCRLDWVDHPVVAYRFHGGQMTRQAERMRTALFMMLDKFFGQPDVPDCAQSVKNEAYACALLHAAAFEYIAGADAAGAQDIAAAMRLHPPLREQNCQRVVRLLMGWSQDPRAAEPSRFLERVIAQPPPGFPGLKRQLRRALADQLLSTLFNGSPETRRARRADLFRAVALKPDWLLNRGVLRMIWDSYKHD